MDEIINTNTIVEDEIYNIFKYSALSPLCKSIFINPVLCLKCQNYFCQKCIDDKYKNNEECPNKFSEPSFQKSMGKNDILSKLKFNCQKCGGEYYYHEITKHNETCNSIKPSNNNIKKIKFKRIIAEDFIDIRKKGQEVIYMTDKKKFSFIL